jgi:DNA-binding MarR family transcriptional regulator/N-acetylglutamate synthase-like GNAT family acetyltransferase
MPRPSTPDVDAVRRFNRFYTRRIGLLERGFLRSDFSLTEVRLLYELSRRDPVSSAGLARDLGIDTGYLSRMVRRLTAAGIVAGQPSASDRRQTLLSLSAKGRKVFGRIEGRQVEDVLALLSPLAESARRQLAASMRTIETLIGEVEGTGEAYVLRPPGSGDLGWIVHRQGRLYHEEYGWDVTFEALLARIVAEYVEQYDARKDACWIAERRHEVVGSVFCIKKSAVVARLRMLYVEPTCRGLGIGTRLVEECIGFARRAGYKRMTLWTNDVLTAARAIYEKAGFELVTEEPHHSYGQDLVAQTWERDL